MYSTFIAYLLWFCSGFGALGLHRFYLGKIGTGILWMCTGGLFVVGSIFDFITLPAQVREANIRQALIDQLRRGSEQPFGGSREENWRYAEDSSYRVVNGAAKKERPEHAILKLAEKNKGVITVSDVALALDISMDEAKKLLDTLVAKNFAELRIRTSGSLVYVILDMFNKDKPMEDF